MMPTPNYFQFEGDWYIKLPTIENTVGPFPTKEDAEEWWNTQNQRGCPTCED